MRARAWRVRARRGSKSVAGPGACLIASMAASITSDITMPGVRNDIMDGKEQGSGDGRMERFGRDITRMEREVKSRRT